MGVRGCQKPIDHHAGWPMMMRHEEVLDGVVKLPIEEMRLADSAYPRIRSTGVEARRGLEMLDRQVGLTRPQSEPTA